ncbi:phage major capsid protein [Pseudobutyrivibrio ruminis]|uniref:Phage major capsid protein n=1 Tax=Pseudobutyrivibrio ruminis TaxID=46206 RepID=A0A2G3DYR4_9FIRM|nr:phage major capsid protein [Pseudobutyrivibrio ruminis]PHU36015.1 phage major capsid protein [Pseudobutyrivibrio ruminis]
MNFKELEEKRAQLQEEMESLLSTAKTEERAMTEEESAKFDGLEKEIKNIDATLAAEKRAEELKITKEEEPMPEVRAEETKVTEESEVRAFEAFVRNNLEELRAGEQQLTEGNNGAIVPTTIANKIIEEVRDMVPFLTLGDVYNTNGKLSVPVYSEDSTNYINADYVDEGTSLVDNIGEFTSVDLTGYVIGALALVSNKLISNTEINITDFVVRKVAEAIAEKLETEFIVGTNNKITGVLGATVRVTTAAAGAITYDELVSLKHSIKKRFRKNAKWIMNDATYEALCKLKDGNHQPYFKDDEYKILGCEVLISDSMPAIAASAKAIVFGDLSGYSIKMTKKVEVKILRERFAERNMVGVIGYGEYDGKITDGKKLAVLQMKAS